MNVNEVVEKSSFINVNLNMSKVNKVNLGKNTYPIFIDQYLNEVGGIINNMGNFSIYIIICDKQF